MLKLNQNQVWALDGAFVRIVRLERLSVSYKLLQDLATRDGTHHEVSKKEFSRMIKAAKLLSPEEIQSAQEPGAGMREPGRASV